MAARSAITSQPGSRLRDEGRAVSRSREASVTGAPPAGLGISGMHTCRRWHGTRISGDVSILLRDSSGSVHGGKAGVSGHAARSISEYLSHLQAALEGEDAGVIQEALGDAEAHLRAEVAAWPQEAEGDVLELITCTYGAPEDVAEIYRRVQLLP
jgi:hypothetical protein